MRAFNTSRSLFSSAAPDESLIRPPAAGVSSLAAAIGDSLTEHAFMATPLYWQLGLQGGPLDLRANSGVSGRSVADLEAQMVNDYLDAGGHPGLAGLPALGWVFIRIGTNGWRGAGPVSSVDAGTQADFLSIISQAKTYAEHVVIFPIPPIVGGVSSSTYPRDVYNAYIRSAVAADTSGRVHWIDDTTDVTDGTGGGISTYFEVDGYHMNSAGTLKMGETAQSQLTALFANQGYSRAPLVTDAADVAQCSVVG